jgi:hypothetical protein
MQEGEVAIILMKLVEEANLKQEEDEKEMKLVG